MCYVVRVKIPVCKGFIVRAFFHVFINRRDENHIKPSIFASATIGVHELK